jgi:hypothetical protein
MPLLILLADLDIIGRAPIELQPAADQEIKFHQLSQVCSRPSSKQGQQVSGGSRTSGGGRASSGTLYLAEEEEPALVRFIWRRRKSQLRGVGGFTPAHGGCASSDSVRRRRTASL